jgi:hypothetical protein
MNKFVCHPCHPMSPMQLGYPTNEAGFQPASVQISWPIKILGELPTNASVALHVRRSKDGIPVLVRGLAGGIPMPSCTHNSQPPLDCKYSVAREQGWP